MFLHCNLCYSGDLLTALMRACGALKHNVRKCQASADCLRFDETVREFKLLHVTDTNVSPTYKYI